MASRPASEASPPAPATQERQEADVEAPEFLPTNDVVAVSSGGHNRLLSEVTIGDLSPALASKLQYTVADLTGNNQEMLAEDDVIRTLEVQQQGLQRENTSTRQLLFPELPDESVIEFEDQLLPEDEEDDAIRRPVSRSTLTKAQGLRDLTAQLLLTTTNLDDRNREQRMGMNNATRGTAADRMADKAVAMFSSTGELPAGVVFDDASGQPVRTSSDVSTGTGRKFRKKIQASREKIKMNRELFVDYFRPRKKVIGHYWWVRIKYIIVPGLAAATLLFYVGNNPPHGKLVDVNDDGNYLTVDGVKPDKPSISWWILFIVRQVVTLSSAKMWEMIIIDFLAMKTGILRAMVGPYVSLWIVQSQGWPFQAVVWGVTNRIFLAGTSEFVRHWLFFQKEIGVFTEENASGNVLDNEMYRALILCTIAFGGATAVKRVILSNVIGKRLVVNYGTQLEALMQKVIQLTAIAGLAKKVAGSNLRETVAHLEIADVASQGESKEQDRPTTTFGSFQFASSDRISTMVALLGDWNEPEYVADQHNNNNVTIASLLHFRRALAFIDAEYPFSFAFGLAKTRVDCVESAQAVFTRLSDDEDTLKFDVLAPLVMGRGGKLNRDKMKALCRLLRPTKEGTLSRIDFLRSIDNVYKELRTLVASIENSSQIEKNYETIVNTIHYFALCAVGLIVIGIDFQAMLVSISALFIGIGFIIGGACANFLEGLLMVFIRRPFDVGDRIAIQEVSELSDAAGAPGWIVEKVDLYTTTLRYGSTRELATVTNGELARKRIVNMQRSKKAVVFIDLKFGVDVSHTQLDQLKSAIQDYVSNRQREWFSLSAFRLTEIHSDLGYVLYRIVLQHQDSWQNVGNVLTSKGDAATFLFLKAKELDMRCNTPSLPVELSLVSGVPDTLGGGEDESPTRTDESPSIKSLRAMFGESKKVK